MQACARAYTVATCLVFAMLRHLKPSQEPLFVILPPLLENGPMFVGDTCGTRIETVRFVLNLSWLRIIYSIHTSDHVATAFHHSSSGLAGVIHSSPNLDCLMLPRTANDSMTKHVTIPPTNINTAIQGEQAFHLKLILRRNSQLSWSILMGGW